MAAPVVRFTATEVLGLRALPQMEAVEKVALNGLNSPLRVTMRRRHTSMDMNLQRHEKTVWIRIQRVQESHNWH